MVALATIAGAIFAIRSAVGVMLNGYARHIGAMNVKYSREQERRHALEKEVVILKDYQRFQPDYPQPGMEIHTHEIETLQTDPVMVMLEGHRDPEGLKKMVRSQLIHRISAALFDRELVEIQTRDDHDKFWQMPYTKAMRAIIRVLNPKANGIESRVQVPHYGQIFVDPMPPADVVSRSSTNSRIKKHKPKQ